jgi:YD repeat-containing protein
MAERSPTGTYTATKFKYDANSNLTSKVFPGESQNEDKYTFNNADQMTEVKMLKGSETLASLGYSRDANGQLIKTVSKGLPGPEPPNTATTPTAV